MNEILKGKTAIITGASRGIGFAIAQRLAAVGANVVIASKTTEPHPKLPGTIYEAAADINAKACGAALPVVLDVRNEDQINNVVSETMKHFGGIDILINNASAIHLAGIEHTPAKRYDLMQDINVRGTYLMSQACVPFLKNSNHAHILTLSPKIDLNAKWFENYSAYTLSKYGMSLVMLGLAAELKDFNIAANALWPKTTIATAAIQNLLGGEAMIRHSRLPSIVADAAYYILSQDPQNASGEFYTDEEVLSRYGISDFAHYAVDPSSELAPDLFIET